MSDDVLAVVGSTHFVDTTAMDTAEQLIIGVLERRRPDRVVSGGAAGIDSLGARLARERGIEVQEFLPANKRWKPDGFQARNDLIADTCTRLMRVACRWSVTYGSGYTHDRAHAQRKTCWNLQLPAAAITNGTIRLTTSRAVITIAVQDGAVSETAGYARTMRLTGRDAGGLITELVRHRTQVEWLPEPS